MMSFTAVSFFEPFNTDIYKPLPGWINIDTWIYRPDGDALVKGYLPSVPFQDSLLKMIMLKNHAKLLAEMIPPLSSPAGGMAIKALVKPAVNRAFNMDDPPYKDTALWPDDRPGKSRDQQRKKRWLHGDYKNAPFRLTHTLYEKIKEISEKEKQ